MVSSRVIYVIGPAPSEEIAERWAEAPSTTRTTPSPSAPMAAPSIDHDVSSRPGPPGVDLREQPDCERRGAARLREMPETALSTELLFAEPTELAPWVEAVWYSSGPLERLRERVLPSASTDIVANLGDPMSMDTGGSRRSITGTTVTGLMTRPFLLEHPPIHEAVGIRLSAHGLGAVLGVPTAAFTDLVVDLDVALGTTVDELVEVCRRAGSPDDRLDAAIRWLTSRIARFADQGDPLVWWASSQIEATHGGLSIRRPSAAKRLRSHLLHPTLSRPARGHAQTLRSIGPLPGSLGPPRSRHLFGGPSPRPGLQ